MPSRRHHKPSAPATPAASNRPAPGPSAVTRDPAEMFAAALRESEEREKAQRERERQQQDAALQRKADAAAQANSLADARRALDAAIEAVRRAKRDGRSTVEADAAWKAAKARVIELETGERPNWAPSESAAAESAEAESADAESAEGEPSDGDSGD